MELVRAAAQKIKTQAAMEERQTDDRKIDDCMNELMNSIDSAETEIPQVESAFKETAATKTQLEAEFKQAQVDRAEAKAGLVHCAESVALSAETLDAKVLQIIPNKVTAEGETGGTELMNSMGSAETKIPQVESALKETAARKTQREARVVRFKIARQVRAEIARQAHGAAPTIAELIAHIAEKEEEARKLMKEKEEDKEEEPGPAHKWRKMS